MPMYLYFQKFILSLILGAVIGFEREINEKKNTSLEKKPVAVLGLRSFSLVALLGSITGFIFLKYQLLALILTAITLLFFVVFYVMDTLHSKDPGITTETALVLTYVLGLMITLEIIPLQIIIALVIVLILLLSRKRAIKDIAEDVTKHEINAFISYAVIALVILPFLPNYSFSLNDIPSFSGFILSIGLEQKSILSIPLLNPFKIWTYVVLITGVEVLGYILEKTIGEKKGWFVASLTGGFISSTATTKSLSIQSKKMKTANFLVATAVMANLISFIQMVFLIAPINSVFMVKLLPVIGVLYIIGLTATWYLFILRNKNTEQTNNKTEVQKSTKIFDLSSALKFAGIFALISLLSKIALQSFGETGFYITTAIGSITGIDAVMINTAELAGKMINYKTAVLAFIIANAVNFASKIFYSKLTGSKEYILKLSIIMFLMVSGTLVVYFLV